MGQCLGQLVVGYVFTNFENLLISTAILVCGQLDILYCSLKNIRYTAILLHEKLNRNMFKLIKRSVKKALHLLTIFNNRRNTRLFPLEANEYYYSYEQRETFDNMDFLKSTIKKSLSQSNG